MHHSQQIPVGTAVPQPPTIDTRPRSTRRPSRKPGGGWEVPALYFALGFILCACVVGVTYLAVPSLFVRTIKVDMGHGPVQMHSLSDAEVDRRIEQSRAKLRAVREKWDREMEAMKAGK